jgi:hypothetical protein
MDIDMMNNKLNNFKTQRELKFTETIDMDKLNFINDNFDLVYPHIGKVKDKSFNPMDKASVKTLVNKRCQNITNEFTYSIAKDKQGRLSSRGWCCQGMNKILRHTIAGEYNYDIDIANCHPNIAYWTSLLLKIEMPHLKHYLDNREDVLQKCMAFDECSREDAKDKILALFNNYCHQGFIESNPLYGLSKEIKVLIEKVFESRKDLHKQASESAQSKDIRNVKGICMSLHLQSIENKIFQCMVFYCQDNNIDITAGCHDGFMATTDSVEEYGGLDKLMRDIEKHVFETLDFTINLTSKPMDKGLDIDKFKMENRILKKKDDDDESISSLSYIDNVETLFEMIEFIYRNGLNDYDCAQAYAKFNDDMFCVDDWGWVMYNSKTRLWELVDKKTNLHSLICKFFKSAFALYVKNVQRKGHTIEKEMLKLNVQLGNSKFASGVIKQLDFFLRRDKTFFNRFESNVHLFSFSDGVCIDLHTYEIRNIKKDDYIMETCGYPLPKRDESDITLAKDLIMSICGDIELYKTITTLTASSLFGKNVNEYCPINQGDGSNGKGVIAEYSKTTFGNYYKELEPAYFMAKQTSENKANSHLYDCIFARYVNVSEPDTDGKECVIQSGTYKRIGCGEDIQTRQLYGKGITYTPKFMLWFQVNDMMKFTKMDDGVARRLINIRFPFQFMNYDETTGIWIDNQHNEYREPQPHWRVKDSSLKGKLKNDIRYRNGLLWLLIDTHKEYNGKVYISKQIRDDSTETIQEQNPIKNWFNDNYDPDENGTLKITELHKTFEKETGKKLSLPVFNRMLRTLIKIDKVRSNNLVVRACKKTFQDNDFVETNGSKFIQSMGLTD